MKVKKLFALLFFFVTGGLYATDISGKVLARNRHNPGNYPLHEARIELFTQKDGKWVLVKKALTDSQGVYHFGNIAPGNYVMRINSGLTYRVRVKDVKKQQLPSIVVRY